MVFLFCKLKVHKSLILLISFKNFSHSCICIGKKNKFLLPAAIQNILTLIMFGIGWNKSLYIKKENQVWMVVRSMIIKVLILLLLAFLAAMSYFPR